MRRHTLPEVATQRQKRREHGDEPPLQPARRADADQLTQEEPEIEAARVDQQPLADVRVAAQVHTAHPAGLVEMREASFQALTAKPQQTQAACAANAPTIAVHRSARLGMVLPVPSSAIGFRDVAADAHGFEIDERLIAVIALVADDFFDTVSVGLYRLDLLGRFNQCLAARRRVSLIGILHGDADDRARLEIDRMLGFVRQVRPSFILVTFASGSCGWVLPLPIHPRQISARRRLDARRLRELRQEVLIALTGVAPHDAAQRRIRLQRRRVDAHSLAIHQARVRKALQHPGEDRLVRLKIDQATRTRDRRVIGRRLRQHQAEKVAQRKRIGSAPGDPALGVDAFEVANQQQSEIDPGGASWGGHRGGVEAGTLRFDEGVEAVLSQQLIQPTIEGMTRGRRQVRRRHPHRRLSVAFSFAHRHGRSVVRFSRMSKLIYITNASLDGYIEDKTGAFDWGNPDQVFDFITELMRPIGTHLLGRRLYETIAHGDVPLEGYPPEHRDFARVWQKAEQIVFSRMLTRAPTRIARVEREFDPEATRKLKRESAHDIFIGGAELAALALESDLVDECHLFLHPVIVGGGKPAFRTAIRRNLELLDTRRFGTGAIHLHYRLRGAVRKA